MADVKALDKITGFIMGDIKQHLGIDIYQSITSEKK